jgi:hypothetical protein
MACRRVVRDRLRVRNCFVGSLVAVLSWRDDLSDPLAALMNWNVIEQHQRQLLAERLAGWNSLLHHGACPWR